MPLLASALGLEPAAFVAAVCESSDEEGSR